MSGPFTMTPGATFMGKSTNRPARRAAPHPETLAVVSAYADGKGPEGGRLDAGKNRLELLPFDGLAAVGDVLTVGANKYADRNWEKGMKWSRVAGSLIRHLARRMVGETHDPETGLLHTAHIACNALFLLTYELRRVGENDLPMLTVVQPSSCKTYESSDSA